MHPASPRLDTKSSPSAPTFPECRRHCPAHTAYSNPSPARALRLRSFPQAEGSVTALRSKRRLLGSEASDHVHQAEGKGGSLALCI